MALTISVRLEKGVLKELAEIEKKWQTDRSEAIRRLLIRALKDWRMEANLEKIKEHEISVGKAAEECGISLAEMLAIIGKKNIDWTGYGEDDIKEDLKLIK